jgi:hypothetical protein
LGVFNARLGAWLGNPRRQTWTCPGPWFGPLHLLDEVFGRTNAESNFIYLSDGGHFENLGVYELVRRRCRTIVACDAEADADLNFESLAGVLRKCRTDFGIPIDIDIQPITRQADTGLSRWHCAIGTIHYEEVHRGALPGMLIYLKASLTGDESTDVREYAAVHPSFPHQSTVDQFFTESQFESYRALGYHIAKAVFGEAIDEYERRNLERWNSATGDVEQVFSAVQRRWFPPPPNLESNFLDTVQGYVAVEEALRKEPNLQDLRQDLYPEMKGGNGAPPMAEVHMVAEMLQVMEDAWLSLQLDGFHAHPLNRGWLNVFRRWAGSSRLRQLWPMLRGEFAQDFVLFCERELNLRPGEVTLRSLVDPQRQSVPPELLREFEGEWPDQAQDLWKDFEQRQPHQLWLIEQEPPTGLNGANGPSLPALSCGLIAAWLASNGGPTQEWELRIWIRGPYRTLGIGRLAMGQALNELAERGRVCVRARLPRLRGLTQGDQLRQGFWFRFFQHLKFENRTHELHNHTNGDRDWFIFEKELSRAGGP